VVCECKSSSFAFQFNSTSQLLTALYCVQCLHRINSSPTCSENPSSVTRSDLGTASHSLLVINRDHGRHSLRLSSNPETAYQQNGPSPLLRTNHHSARSVQNPQQLSYPSTRGSRLRRDAYGKFPESGHSLENIIVGGIPGRKMQSEVSSEDTIPLPGRIRRQRSGNRFQDGYGW
jgi:hypothetical protein